MLTSVFVVVVPLLVELLSFLETRKAVGAYHICVGVKPAKGILNRYEFGSRATAGCTYHINTPT